MAKSRTSKKSTSKAGQTNKNPKKTKARKGGKISMYGTIPTVTCTVMGPGPPYQTAVTAIVNHNPSAESIHAVWAVLKNAAGTPVGVINPMSNSGSGLWVGQAMTMMKPANAEVFVEFKYSVSASCNC